MSMSAKYAQVLDECRVTLVKDLEPNDVVDYLIQDGVFTTDDLDKVNSKNMRKDKVRLILEIIPRRSDRAFNALVKALQDLDSGHHHLYDLLVGKLEEVERSGVPMQYEQQQQEQDAAGYLMSREPITCTEPNPGDSADARKACSQPHQPQRSGYDYPEHMHNEPKSPNMVPSDRLLSLLAGKLGAEWEQLAVFLGLSASDIYRCKMENQYNMWGQSYNALIRWRNREYKNATIHRLVKGLRECNIGRENYEYLMNA
ncbi:death domain-containing protein CRADD-like isoform X2 [Patiria miniata]|nr:death domain-containing protein CRADD-like isoform X2 [Patiria miniata]